MLTIKTHGVEFSIAGGVEEMVRDPNPMPFFFFFYHAFIVFRYKKLRAALAMERTKPIIQKQITKETHSSLSSAATENLLSLKLFGYRTFRQHKYREKTATQTTSRLRAFCKEN